MPSQSEGASPRFRRKEMDIGSKKNGAKTRKKTSMRGEISPVSPDFTNLRKRQSHSPPPPP
eukprot:CAMPEP_0113656288 /NCGR_PEP_ID=MMETSP0017_2-20120614/30251_1 /TAXON_ID=2856 /ORGANISM="Cylindrotheca closterium" /LENGTH=60 /DNA_ID=CAMNT_0000569775 /DNA_START=11 /DNA_END=190 /DNA_ORIENTATION=+ /assembly_acc=CAM_ASM_000147